MTQNLLIAAIAGNLGILTTAWLIWHLASRLDRPPPQRRTRSSPDVNDIPLDRLFKYDSHRWP